MDELSQRGSFYCILSIFMPHSEGHVLAMSWLLDLSERKWILNYVRPCFIFRQMGAQWHTLCSHHIKSPTFLDFHDKQTAFHKRDESALSNSNFAKHVLKLFKRWAPLTFAHVYFSSGSHIILLQQSHLTSDVLFPKKFSTINQGVPQKLEPTELRLVKTRKKSHCRIRRYCRLDFTTVFTK